MKATWPVFYRLQDQNLTMFAQYTAAPWEYIGTQGVIQGTFQTLVALHGSVTNHLVATARPLPRMTHFEFFEPLPSLVMAYRLYDDASRCDELREENKVVHPAFCPMAGRALSA